MPIFRERMSKMITLKLTCYEEENLTMLIETLEKSMEMIHLSGNCKDAEGQCGDCRIRKLCGDVSRAFEYAKGYSPKRKEKATCSKETF